MGMFAWGAVTTAAWMGIGIIGWVIVMTARHRWHKKDREDFAMLPVCMALGPITLIVIIARE